MKDPFESNIPVDRILLDIENPRLPEITENQRETIIALSKVQGKQLLVLAEHILTNGFDPSVYPMVMPTKDEPANYIALDGNRRINSLKILETPEILRGSISEKEFGTLKKLSNRYLQNPKKEIKCVVFPTRASADVWIKLRHRGQNEGAGSVEWSGQVSARYDERRGKHSMPLQLLDFIKEKSSFNPETQKKLEQGKYPITTLERLLNTTYVREKLGIEKKDGKLKTRHAANDIIPALKKIVDDIGSGTITVSDLKSQKQRIEYISSLDEDLMPKEASENNELKDLKESDVPEKKSTPPKRKPKKIKKTIRTTLIPEECLLNIQHHRIDDIYEELKKIDSDKYPNSVAVMFRVFLELSMDFYLENVLKWGEHQVTNTFLLPKMNAVITHFETQNFLDKNKLAGIKNVASKSSILGPSYKTLHGFVHNYNVAPIPSELRKLWDNVEPFFIQMWS